MITEIQVNEGDYSPEEYASFWGADPMFCKAPRLPQDGYLFYNFGSDKLERTKEWLTEFVNAIDRLMLKVSSDKAYNKDMLADQRNNLDGLQQLKQHVQELIK